MSFTALDVTKLSFDPAGASLKAAQAIAPQWAWSFNARDLDELIRLYDPAAALFPTPDSDPIVGPNALRRFFSDLAQQGLRARLSPEPAARRLSERIACVEGACEFAPDKSQAAPLVTKYRLLLVRHIRTWRIYEHHSTRLPVAA